MAEYIDKAAAIKLLTSFGLEVSDSKRSAVAKCISKIEFMPAADVAPVRHGEWRLVRRMAACGEYECSVCGRIETFGCFNKPENNPYCHCGAKMQGAGKEKEVE